MKKATKRADGRYQKSVLIGRRKDGSPIRKAVYASTQAELNRKVAELQHDAATGKCIHSDITFRRLSEIWMKQFPSLSKRWHKRKQCELDNHLLPALGELKISELHLINLQNVLNDMAEQGYASSTMRKIKQCASAIMDFACDNDWLNRNCFLKAKVVSMEAPETRFLDDNEIRLITSSWEGHRFGIAAMIMLYCGLRRGEVLALEWDDIDYKTNVIHVTKARDIDANKAYLKKPKTKAGTRDVPIPTILLHALKKLDGKHGLIAPDKDGKLMSSTAYKRAWEGYLLDEPENSLSIVYQQELAKLILDSARYLGCQFVIASHSPVLLSIPDALIYDLDADPVRTKKWTELDNIRKYFDFFEAHRDEFKAEDE